MPNALAVSLAASAIRTTSGDGVAVDIGVVRTAARLRLVITEVSGAAPVLTFTLSTSDNGTTGWRPVTQLGTTVGIALIKRNVAGLGRFVRVSWTIAGTSPSFTFEVTAVTHTLYAEPSDLGIAIVGTAIEDMLADDIVDACIVSSEELDGYLSGGYTLPITAWGDDLKLHAAKVATYHLMNSRGRQPSGPDDLIDLGYAHALKWARGVSDRNIRPSGIVDSTPEIAEAGSAGVVSTELRGW